MTDKKKVWLSIKGTIKQSGREEDTIELITEGKMYKRQKSNYIIYDETEVSGLQGTTTTLKIDDGKLSIIRLGSMNSHMIFEKGKKKYNTYSTPYGDMSMSVYTEDVSINYDNENEPTQIYVDYNVEIQGLMSAKNVLDIEVKH